MSHVNYIEHVQIKPLIFHCKKLVFFCDVSKNRRHFAGHQHFGKRNVEERWNEWNIVQNMEMLVGKRGHVSFQTWG